MSVALPHFICHMFFLFVYYSALGAGFVSFCFLNTREQLGCLWMQLSFPCTKSGNIHLSQGMKYQTLLVQTLSEVSASDTAQGQTCAGEECVLQEVEVGRISDRHVLGCKLWI